MALFLIPSVSKLLGAKDKPKGETPEPETGEANAKPGQLVAHDIDIPEEPEEVNAVVQEWDNEKNQFVERNLGKRLLVPTGCERPTYFSPFENSVTLKSALPRDKEKDTNLYQAWQTNGWVSRHWVMSRLEEGISISQMDKEIADDIPFILSIQGKPDPSGQVAQTNGLQQPGDGPGDNNGAPLPPGPGPGRGNKFAPGDGLAKAPPNASPGRKM